MDKEPFLDINLLGVKDNQTAQLCKFKKENLNVTEILNTASLLKYNNIFKNYFDRQLKSPSDEFVKVFLQSAYKGAKTQAVIEKFRPILAKALNDYINESLNEKIQTVLNNTSIEQAQRAGTVINTDEHWDILTIVKEILSDTIDINKITLKHTESYTAVLYESNSRKWICRLILSNSQKAVIIPDENKKELKYQIEKVEDLHGYSDQIIEVAQRYLHPSANTVLRANKEILHTKWGNYEMPDPYLIDLTRGPRKDLREIR